MAGVWLCGFVMVGLVAFVITEWLFELVHQEDDLEHVPEQRRGDVR